MRRWKRNLLMPWAGGAGGPVYLLRDEFTTPQAAPLITPRTCEPGPGVMVITDASNVISINASSKLVCNGSMSVDSGYITTQFTRTPGMISIWTFGTITSPTNSRFGWNSVMNSSLKLGFIYTNTPNWQEVASSANMPVFSPIPTAHAIMELAVGGLWFALVGGVWELVWRFSDDVTATPMGAVTYLNHFGVPNFELDAHTIRLLPAPFDSAYGISTFTDTTLADSDTFTGVADAIYSFEFTLSGTPSANDIVGFKYRQQDANNYWYAYLKYSGTQWDAKIDSVAAGVATNRLSATAVGTPDMLRVTCKGTKHNLYTRASTAYTKRGGQVDISHMDAQTGMTLVAAAGTTLTRLTCDPKLAAIYTTELSRT